MVLALAIVSVPARADLEEEGAVDAVLFRAVDGGQMCGAAATTVASPAHVWLGPSVNSVGA